MSDPRRDLPIHVIARLRREMGYFRPGITDEEKNEIEKRIRFFKKNPNELPQEGRQTTRYASRRISRKKHYEKLVSNPLSGIKSASREGLLGSLPPELVREIYGPPGESYISDMTVERQRRLNAAEEERKERQSQRVNQSRARVGGRKRRKTKKIS